MGAVRGENRTKFPNGNKGHPLGAEDSEAKSGGGKNSNGRKEKNSASAKDGNINRMGQGIPEFNFSQNVNGITRQIRIDVEKNKSQTEIHSATKVHTCNSFSILNIDIDNNREGCEEVEATIRDEVMEDNPTTNQETIKPNKKDKESKSPNKSSNIHKGFKVGPKKSKITFAPMSTQSVEGEKITHMQRVGENDILTDEQKKAIREPLEKKKIIKTAVADDWTPLEFDYFQHSCRELGLDPDTYFGNPTTWSTGNDEEEEDMEDDACYDGGPYEQWDQDITLQAKTQK